ncbi:hypothetical protein HispidOSU_030186, partial [Sigmodon hispidus]
LLIISQEIFLNEEDLNFKKCFLDKLLKGQVINTTSNKSGKDTDNMFPFLLFTLKVINRNKADFIITLIIFE